jgi:GNAT superfamily N-acetyltransferase
MSDPTLPDGYRERPVTDADLDAVIELVDDADRALGLDPDPMRDFLTWLWHLPTTDLERDTRLVVSDAGVACYAQGTWNPDEGGPLDGLVRVHPDHARRGLGSRSLAWAEALAAESGGPAASG